MILSVQQSRISYRQLSKMCPNLSNKLVKRWKVKCFYLERDKDGKCINLFAKTSLLYKLLLIVSFVPFCFMYGFENVFPETKDNWDNNWLTNFSYGNTKWQLLNVYMNTKGRNK